MHLETDGKDADEETENEADEELERQNRGDGLTGPPFVLVLWF